MIDAIKKLKKTLTKDPLDGVTTDLVVVDNVERIKKDDDGEFLDEPVDVSIRDGFNIWAKHYDYTKDLLIESESNRLIKLAGIVKNKKILDAGCSTGRLSIELVNMGATITSVDFAPVMITRLNEKMINVKTKYKNNIRPIIADLERIKFKKDEFDIIICSQLVNHFANLKILFKNLNSALKKEGILLISMVNPFSDPSYSGPIVRIRDKQYHIPAFHHYLDTIFDLLKKNYDLVDIIEPRIDSTLKFLYRHNIYNQYQGKPVLLILKFIKKK